MQAGQGQFEGNRRCSCLNNFQLGRPTATEAEAGMTFDATARTLIGSSRTKIDVWSGPSRPAASTQWRKALR